MLSSRQVKRASVLLVLYTLMMWTSIWLAYQLRFDFRVPETVRATMLAVMVAVVLAKLISLLLFRQFDALLSYFGLVDAQRIFFAMGAADLIFLGLRFSEGISIAPPRSTVLTDFVLSFFGLCLIRAAFRLYREHFGSAAVRQGRSTETSKRLGVYGAGDVGAALIRELAAKPRTGLRVVAVFDDDPVKWRTQLHGVTVVGSLDKLVEKHQELALDGIVIAMPSASIKRLREIVFEINRVHLKCETVPSMPQLVTGQVRVSQIRPVELEDLLGREPVDLESGRIRDLVEGKVVLVTGAGGSIGSELCRQIASYNPRLLLMVERCEIQLFQIEQELLSGGRGSEVVPLVADILDPDRMRGLFNRFHPSLVFHAAAHKHVPLMEHQPFEAFRNNTLGTRQLAQLAVEFGVDRFILISTDKAINPTNVMGASKRLAEIYLQALQQHRVISTKFMAVRFGNVLGSSGSVIPTFKKQIADGGPVTVTHPEVTRYFMTVYEAVGLILQSGTQGKDGEIFVLDMGSPIKIVDLARQLIELSGLTLGLDIAIKFTGLRPGEKLFEELNHNTESVVTTSHPKIMRFIGEFSPWAQLDQKLMELSASAKTMEANQVKLEIQQLVPEYKPFLSSV